MKDVKPCLLLQSDLIKTVSRLLMLGFFLMSLFASQEGFGQTFCIPGASGVPALSGPPNWWDAAAGEPNYWPRLDDPRWRGSLSRSWGTGASEHVQFRALRDGNSLYLSWHVKVDPQLDPYADSLKVAFSQDGAPDVLIEVIPFDDLAANRIAVLPTETITRLRPAGGNFVGVDQLDPKPSWLSTAYSRIWLDVAEQTWAINMRVPIAASINDGLDLGTDFKMWFELTVTLAGVDVTYYSNSSALTYNDIEAGLNSNNWPVYSRNRSQSDAACAHGVSITSSDIGTRYVDSGGVTRPNRISLTNPSTFFAQPKNETGSDIPANKVCAQFRIGNWGTQPNWNDVADPTTTLWKLISPECGLPGNLTNSNTIVNGAKASTSAGNEITFNWTIPNVTPSTQDIDRCDFTGRNGVPAGSDGVAIPGDPSCPNADPVRRLHQCMLVELSGGGYDYLPSSVYRNMDFVNASTFSREAEVSVAGLKQIPGATKRDVYLYIKRYNMPESTASPSPRDALRDFAKLSQIMRSSKYESRSVAATAYLDPDKLPKYPPMGVDFDTLNQLYPTYVVHAYHDTGVTASLRGKVYKVLSPQSSFGYYVYHEGRPSGWTSAVEGAEKIAPDYYRIAAPEGGAAKIRTKIEAREPGLSGICALLRTTHASVLVGILIVAAILVYWLVRRKK